MKKILAFTSIRSEYDLMVSLYKLLKDDADIDFKLLISGAHLSHSFGYSVKQIKEDKFDVLLEVETLISSDTAISRIKTASLLLQNSLETIAKYNPDLMIFAGDREDVLMYAMIGCYLNIPTIHVFAGDHASDGYVDNPIRHATSKLATAHFVTIEEHKKRLIRIGEEPQRIFVIGNISLDKFLEIEQISKSKLKSHFNIQNGFNDFALVIFHPITEEIEQVDIYFENILRALEQKTINAFVSYPNIDPGNTKLLKVIEKYKNNTNFIFYKNLNRDLFLSIYKNSAFIIGNSSSGICEAASLRIPAINVGLRQTGRHADKNVIFCGTSHLEICKSIDYATSEEFKLSLQSLSNSYGDGKSAIKAYEIIKTTNFKSMILKKSDPLNIESI